MGLASPESRAEQLVDHGVRGQDEGGVVRGLGSVAQERSVLKPGAHPVTSPDRPLAHRPTRKPVSVVNLLKSDAGTAQYRFHGSGMGHGRARVEIERLDENPRAARCQTGTDEGLGVLQSKQPGLDSHAASEKCLAKLDNSLLPLICRNEIGELLPFRHEFVASARLGLDRGERGQRNGYAWARDADFPQHRSTAFGRQRLTACMVVGVQMHDPRPSVHCGPSGRRNLSGSARNRRMFPRAVESDVHDSVDRLSYSNRVALLLQATRCAPSPFCTDLGSPL